MRMTPEHTDPSSADQILARHQAFAEVLQGKRAMSWSDWAMPIHESQCLTPQGLSVALWAVETLQQTLGNNFLQRAMDAPASHPIYLFGLWPANDVPWVYVNLFQLAAQIRLLNVQGDRLKHVLHAMRRNLDPINWAHSLLQLEVASLGLRAGWQIQFEPELGTGKSADVYLSKECIGLLVETVSMRQSDRERKAFEFFRRFSSQVQNLAWQHPVKIEGSLGEPLAGEAEAQWFQEIEAAVRTTSFNGIAQEIRGPAEGRLIISKETTTTGMVNLEGAPVIEDTLGRLVARLRDKNRQAAGGGPVWVRLEEYAGLWQFTPLQRMTLQEKLDALTLVLQQELTSFSNLAGVILSPAVLWGGNVPQEAQRMRFENSGGIGLSCPIPGHRVRESIIVTQTGAANMESKIFADLYTHESTWLDWALEQLHHPPFDTLVQDFPSEAGQ